VEKLLKLEKKKIWESYYQDTVFKSKQKSFAVGVTFLFKLYIH